jgi:SAM-dependent methyltransferase
MPQQPKLYTDLADWWHLLSRVEDYAEEAAIYAQTLKTHARRPIETVLEIGTGGGNNAYHMKASFEMTLVDLSEAMLAQSQHINAECEHHAGDMRSVRLDKTFDAVFIHDAIAYLTTPDDLRQTMETAFVHCRSSGVALFAPDHIQETFQPSTDHGGYDGPDQGLRYLEWTWDPDPTDTTHLTDYAYLLRLPDGSMRVEHDRHVNGLFARQAWLNAIEAAGFEPLVLPFEHSEMEPAAMSLFLGIKP